MSISFRVLKDPDASRLFCGQLFSQACDKMMSIGLVWVLTQDYSPRIIPWFLGVAALPHLLFSMHAGRWTEKLGPLKTIVWSDVARGVLFLVLTVLWPHLALKAQVPTLFAFAFFSNIAAALFNPAILSLPIFLPHEDLIQQLTALIDSCFSFGNILGPLLSAVLYPVLGLKGLFAFNGISYLIAAFLEAPVKLKPAASAADALEINENRRASVLRIIRKDRLIAFMLSSFLAINLFLAPLTVFLPLFAKLSYHGTLRTLASFETALAIGMVLGGVLLSLFQWSSRIGVKIGVCTLAVSVCYLAFVVTRHVWLGCALLLLLGLSLAMVNIFSLNLFQTRPKPDEVPTVMSLVNLISVASLPFSMVAVGLLMEKINIDSLSLLFGVILFVVTLFVVSNRELRTHGSPAEEPQRT